MSTEVLNAYLKERDCLFEELSTEGSDVVQFLNGKSLFITGATGFFGKILVEKLLRSAPEITNIYVLFREKKGKKVETRLDELYNDVIFSRLKTVFPTFRNKIIPIKGDVGQPELGISPEDRATLAENVNIIIHCAATVRFDEKLRLAAEINVHGTKEMLLLGKDCKNLVSYVHVSTAFSHCPRKYIEEKFYDPPMTTDELFELIKNYSDDELEVKTREILGEWPNTYAFTKAVSEHTVQIYGQNLPLSVYRPSIVVSTYKEPIKGWIDNLYGPTGVVIGAATGLIRTLYCDENNISEIVPVDMVVNGLILVTYTNQFHKNEIPIYNYVSSNEKSLTWKRFMHLTYIYGYEFPTKLCIWYYSLRLVKYYPLHLLYVIFLHFLPAIIVDGVCLLVNKKPILINAYKKVTKFSNVISYFTMRQWKFENQHVQDLWLNTNETDKKLFPFSIKDLSWDEYFKFVILGCRVYLLKDDLSSLEASRKKYNKFKILHNTVALLFYIFVVYILYSVFNKMFL